MASQYVAIINETGEELFLCVQVPDPTGELYFRESNLPAGSLTIDSTETDVVIINTQRGQCP